jgi:uncharacterized protein (DUF2267 family)
MADERPHDVDNPDDIENPDPGGSEDSEADESGPDEDFGGTRVEDTDLRADDLRANELRAEAASRPGAPPDTGAHGGEPGPGTPRWDPPVMQRPPVGEPVASAAPDTGGTRGFPPERQEGYPVAGGAVEAADRQADEEEEAAAAHDPLGPAGFVEERDVTGGLATALAEREGTEREGGEDQGERAPNAVAIEGPDAGPVLNVGPPVAPGPVHPPPPESDELPLGSRWLEPFAHTLQHTRAWMRDVALALGSSDPRDAWHALQAVLGALRDQLPVAEVADLAAELPVPLRGLFLEGWTGAASRTPSRASFLGSVEQRLGRDAEIEPERAVRAVARVLRERVSSGEIDDVINVLPDALKELVGAD